MLRVLSLVVDGSNKRQLLNTYNVEWKMKDTDYLTRDE